ncbi:hypothetical protein R0381_001101 [Jeongeupia wiesaeckerbachi]
MPGHGDKIITEALPPKIAQPAEPEHQGNSFERFPNSDSTCRFLRPV